MIHDSFFAVGGGGGSFLLILINLRLHMRSAAAEWSGSGLDITISSAPPIDATTTLLPIIDGIDRNERLAERTRSAVPRLELVSARPTLYVCTTNLLIAATKSAA